MRIKPLTFTLLFFIAFNGSALNPTIQFNNFSQKNSIDTLTRTLSTDLHLYKLILSGKEEQIKKYFRGTTVETLCKLDSGTIAKAFKKMNTNDKVSRTIWILEETKNREIEIRAYVYSELLRIDFGKPSFLLNHMINNYFVNYSEKDTALYDKIRKLHSKMNR